MTTVREKKVGSFLKKIEERNKAPYVEEGHIYTNRTDRTDRRVVISINANEFNSSSKAYHVSKRCPLDPNPDPNPDPKGIHSKAWAS